MPQISVAPSPEPSFALGATLAQAKKELRRGNMAITAFHFGRVLRRFPANIRARNGIKSMGSKALPALIDHAQGLQKKGHLDEAEKFWACAVEIRPDQADLGLSLARCRIGLGRSHAALKAVERVVEYHPDKAEVLDMKGCILRDLGHNSAAESCHKAALEQGAAGVGPLNHLGILALSRGDDGEAEQYFRQAIDLRPDILDLHRNLSRSITYTEDEPHLGKMQEMAAAADPRDSTFAALHFALFNAYDNLGDVDRAFTHLATGNRMRKTEMQFDIRKEAVRFAWFKSLFENPLAPLECQDATRSRPIFVVGLPRSGTTLVERILSRTDNAQPAGELSVVSTAIAPILRKLEREGRRELTTKDLQTLRTRMLTGLASHSDGSPVIIDKMPLNFRWVGFICAAMPEARIVSLTRDPMAVGWSLYRHVFAGPGNGFAYDLGDIAAYMLLHKDLTQYWAARYHSQIISLKYTDLIEDTKTTVCQLIDDCDLPWSNDCLTPHSAKTAERTASAGQVRKPIYQGSDLSWRRYQRYLEPFSEVLRTTGLA